jgi:hypothetical protein
MIRRSFRKQRTRGRNSQRRKGRGDHTALSITAPFTIKAKKTKKCQGNAKPTGGGLFWNELGQVLGQSHLCCSIGGGQCDRSHRSQNASNGFLSRKTRTVLTRMCLAFTTFTLE